MRRVFQKALFFLLLASLLSGAGTLSIVPFGALFQAGSRVLAPALAADLVQVLGRAALFVGLAGDADF